jgi:Tol biopolymer transport system component
MIAYTSDAADPYHDIRVMNADGSNPTRLQRGPRIDERRDWSLDGSQITFSRNRTSGSWTPTGRTRRIDLWTMRVEGSRRVQRTFGRLDFLADWQPV